MKAKDILREVQESNSHSYWLKDAISSLSKRDVCDAHADVEVLAEYCNAVAQGMGFSLGVEPKCAKISVLLEAAAGHAQSSCEILRKANGIATPLEHIILLPLIREAETLRQKIAQLRSCLSGRD